MLLLTGKKTAFKFRGILQAASFVRATTIRQPVIYFLFPYNTNNAAAVTFTLTDSSNVVYGPYTTIQDGVQSLGPYDPLTRKSNITYASSLPFGDYLLTITGTVGGKARTSKSRFRILSMPGFGGRLNVSYGTRAGVAYGVTAK